MKKLLITLILLWSCSSDPAQPEFTPPRTLNLYEQQIVNSNEIFAFKLFRQINSASNPDSNLFISPLSVSMALGMTLNGADGATFTDMQNCLELSGLSRDEINTAYKNLIALLINIDPQVKFQIANSIWYREGFPVKQPFIDVNREFFDAEVSELDFSDPASVTTINNWVYAQTNGKIETIINQISPLTMMYLINAIYFKGTWQYEFDPDLTSADIFYTPSGNQVNCQMMNQEVTVGYFEDAEFRAVDLPYNHGAFSMTVILPYAAASLDSLINGFSTADWNQLLDNLSETELNLSLPKFKFSYELTMNRVLSILGMANAFDPVNADFTNIYEGNENLYISKVKHKTFVEVNEEGTEAAAVTSVEMEFTTAGIHFRADHPFMLVIREKYSGAVLFVGKITEPIIE